MHRNLAGADPRGRIHQAFRSTTAAGLAGWIRRHVAGLVFERRLGIRTTGHVSLRSLDIDSKDGVDYDPSGWLTLKRALRKGDVSREDVFLDLGSGKGRIVVLAAASYHFKRVLGVELSSQLHDLAVQNVRRTKARLKCRDIVLVNADAKSFQIPDDVTVAYLFNPFVGETFISVARALIASYDRRPRSVRIIYENPEEGEALLGTGRVQLERTITTHGGLIKTYRIVPARPGSRR